MRAKGPMSGFINLHSPHCNSIILTHTHKVEFLLLKIVYLEVLDGNNHSVIIAAGVSGHNSVYTAMVIFHVPALLFPV